MKLGKKIITIGLIVLITSGIAMAATTLNNEEERKEPAVVVFTQDSRIGVMLCAHGLGYDSGYSDYMILINGEKVDGLPDLFVVGERIVIGQSGEHFIVDGKPLDPGCYKIAVQRFYKRVHEAYNSLYKEMF